MAKGATTSIPLHIPLSAPGEPAGVLDFRLSHGPWKGDVPAERWDDRDLCDGNLFVTFRALMERFARLVPSRFALGADGVTRRGESPELEAVREALVNLLVHQDYGDRHRTARALWFRDRMVFDNPGDSWVDQTLAAEGGASELRNPFVARMFRLAGLAEQIGAGLRAIRDSWAALGRAAPQVHSLRAQKQFRLELPGGAAPREAAGEAGSEATNEAANDAANEGRPRPAAGLNGVAKERRLFEVISTSPGIRTTDLCQALGWSRSTVQRLLAGLERAARIEFRGARKNGGYWTRGAA